MGAVEEIRKLQKGWTRGTDERAIRDLFLAIAGRALTELKQALDIDLQRLLFHDIDDRAIREEILAHFEKESPPTGLIKVLSDIDDTVYANWKDKRYPPKTIYPGVKQFQRELGRDVVFVTARPGVIERLTRRSLHKIGFDGATILPGSLGKSISNARIASKKAENFLQYRRLFPEFDFVFTGDSGQGDVDFGRRILTDRAVRAVFIHDVVATPSHAKLAWRRKKIIFFDTYAGAAVEAFREGILPREAVARVVAAAREEFEKIRFESQEQRLQRLTELEHDSRAANAL